MFNPPNLFQGRQLAERRSRFTGMFGMPDNWMDAERTLNEMRPQQQDQIQPMQPTPGRLIPPSAGPMKRVNPMDGSARYFGVTPTGAGQVPAGIMAANPEAYFDPRTGSTVIGDPNRVNQHNVGGLTWSGNAMKNGTVMNNTNNATFGMPAPNERRGTIGGLGTPSVPDMFGHQFDKPSGPPPMGTTQSGGKSFAPMPWEIPGYADGGEVDGPGGPKDDMVPAMLSDGEFVMPAEAVKFFGIDRLEKMKAKAKEGLMEMKADKPPSMHGGIMHMAAGGFVNPYADDPALYARRQQEARDASLAASGITDMGGGNRVLSNRYGPGYAVPTTQGIPDMPGRFNDGGNTVTATPGRGLSMVPDIVPAGPWAAPALPWEAQPQRENIAFMQRQMIPGAEGRRADDLATDTRQMALQPKGRRIITVPDATWKPQPGTGNQEPGTGTFMAPWEKDAQAAAQRNAPIQPFLDAGMKKSEIRQMMRTPQGLATLQDMQPEQWTPIPGTDYMQGRKGQTVPMRRAGEQVAVPPGMVADSMTVAGVRYKAPQSANPADSGIHATKDVDGVIYNVMKDGTMKRAVIEDPTPQQKTKAFNDLYKREPKSPQDWSEAYYLASGKPRGETAAAPTASAPAAKIREFATPEEAMKAGLKPGDRVMVGGRAATWK